MSALPDRLLAASAVARRLLHAERLSETRLDRAGDGRFEKHTKLVHIRIPERSPESSLPNGAKHGPTSAHPAGPTEPAYFTTQQPKCKTFRQSATHGPTWSR